MNVQEQFTIAGRSADAIAVSVEEGIRTGAWPPGAPLPTVRQLAQRLGVSPATVAAAYRRLGDRGIVTAHGRRGTHVSHRPPLFVPSPDAVPEGARNLAEGNPDPALLPDLRALFGGIETISPAYGGPVDLPALLELAARGFSSDGIDARHCAVVGGALDGIERVLGAHLRPGDRVAIEDPGFPRVLDLVAALGLVPEPVALDARGPLPESVAVALQHRPEAFIVTPRAQNPTGAAIDAVRAQELGAVLDRAPNLLVIEDDHAGVAAGAPAATLTTGRERWATVRSVSKTLGPDLRLAVMAGDPTTIARVEGRQLLGTGWVSHILQAAVVALWSDAGIPRLLERAAHSYAERREGLLEALRENGIEAEARSGLNVWIPVPDERAVATGLLDLGWGVARGEAFRIRTGPAIRVTVAALDPADSQRFAVDLVRSMNPRHTRTLSA